MGKMKISNKKNSSTGMPSWLLTVLVIVIMAGAVITCLALALGNTGIVPRMTTAIKSENFKINQNMMTYFLETAQNEFVSSTAYSNLGKNCSLNSGSNQGLPLSEQIIGEGESDESLAPGYSGKTWRDFLVDNAKDNAITVLAYCEEAYANGIELDDADDAKIENELENMYNSIRYSLYQANSYNMSYLTMTKKDCVTAYFGKGVSSGDVKDAMELIALANKAEQTILNDLSDAISLDEIAEVYNADTKKYEKVDFLNYSFNVKYDQVSSDVLAELGEDAKAEENEDKILAAYKEEIDKAQKRASALNDAKDKDEFVKTALAYFVEDSYEDAYEAAKTAQNLDDEKKPSEDDEAKIKEAMIEAMFTELFAEDRKDTAVDDVEEKDEKFYAYGVEVTSEYGKFLNAIKDDLYGDLIYEEESILNDGFTYPTLADGASEKANVTWLYAEDRKEGDTTVIDDGDGADGKEITATEKSFSADVYFMIKPRYLDETIVRNGAYMQFESADNASSAIEALKSAETVDLETFLTIATTYGAKDFSELKDYAPGQLVSEDFDAWMFDSAREKGDYTEQAVSLYGYYHILGYYEDEGTLKAWQAGIKNTLLQEDLTEENKRVTEAYEDTITVKDNVPNKVGK
ncbi:MAG: hypothetical protein J6M03_06780 [Clostridia bacterium]|nr:hypothetical protein [Clostridia bacterium]